MECADYRWTTQQAHSKNNGGVQTKWTNDLFQQNTSFLMDLYDILFGPSKDVSQLDALESG